MGFVRYQHIERFGTSEVEGIEFGECFVFPKIDGTNASVWFKDGKICAGSRNRKLSLESDNAGFYAHVAGNDKLKEFFESFPQMRLYGEWLVPHTLKTYRDTAWRKFYVFDMCLTLGEEKVEYIPYEVYKVHLDYFGIDYIPCLGQITNPDYESLIRLLNANNFLIEDGKGIGEGIVIKNYDFYNRYKRQTWAKIVGSEFKEKHLTIMGHPEITAGLMMEERIVNDFCTEAFIEKEYAKFIVENGGWESKFIPKFLNLVFNELIREESLNFLKKYKMPTINYKTLNALVIQKIKKTKQEIFN